MDIRVLRTRVYTCRMTMTRSTGAVTVFANAAAWKDGVSDDVLLKARKVHCGQFDLPQRRPQKSLPMRAAGYRPPVSRLLKARHSRRIDIKASGMHACGVRACVLYQVCTHDVPGSKYKGP